MLHKKLQLTKKNAESFFQSVEDTHCPVSEAQCRVDVASSGCPMLGLGDVPLGTTASFERSKIFCQVVI